MKIHDLMWRQVLARMTVPELLALKALKCAWEERPPAERDRELGAIFASGDASDCADCGCAAKYHGGSDGTPGMPCLVPLFECDGYRPGGRTD